MSIHLVSKPHDSAFKGFMTKLGNARDFFEAHLPSRITQYCNFDTLILTSASFIDKTLRSRLSDLLYRVETKQGSGYFYLLVEHQSTPDKLMGWRLMHYAFSAMNQHLQQGHHALPLIVPIQFYHGDPSPYPYSRSWTDCFQWSDLAHDLYCNPLPLIDINAVSDDEILTHRKVAAMELAFKYSARQGDIVLLSKRLAHVIKENENHRDDVILIINYLFNVMDSTDYTQIVQALINQTEKYEETIMNIAQRLRDEGMQKGIEKGIEQGIEQGIQQARKEEIINTRQRMRSLVITSLSLGLSIDVISQISGLSHSEIQVLSL
ncbi:TPA: Rpn family recombination-promoting nuclease/putative transposase [Providencia alcalifaciens]